MNPVKLELAKRACHAEEGCSGSFRIRKLTLRKIKGELVPDAPERGPATVELFQPGNALRTGHLNKVVEFGGICRLIKLRHLSGPKQMTPVVGGDGEAVKLLLDFFLEAVDSDLCVENVQNVPDRDASAWIRAALGAPAT